ncbi:hypothetical protein HQ529_04535 [Candidatus Woesearchaeota archaeon]|nr:hypothetical protein [Candidatus Woesearchaeota archaeon]
MTELVVCLGTGKGTWIHVAKLISEQEWEKIFLITNDFGKEKFDVQKPHEFILVDPNKTVKELTEEVKTKITGKIAGTEVAINIISGTGKEHTAIIGALLKLGVGIRLVTYTGTDVQEV